MVPDLRPRGIGELLDAAVVLYRARFGQLIRFTAIVVVPVQLLLTIVLLSAQPDDFSAGITGGATPQFNTVGSAKLGAAFVVLVVGVLTHAFVVAVTTRIVADQYVGHEENAGQILRTAGRRFFAVIGVGLLVAISEAVGALFCFVGLFAALALFAAAVPALILEGKGVRGALSRSVELTRAHFWHVLGLVISASLLGTVLSFGITAGLDFWLRHGGGTTTLVIVQGIANAIAGTLTTPFVATATVALYFDLRIRDEAYDVQMAISGR